MTIQMRAQPNLATCQRGKQNRLGIQLHVGFCRLIMDLWSHGSIFPHNVMTWAHFPPQKKPHSTISTLFFGRQDEKFGPQKHHLVISQVFFFQPANGRMKYTRYLSPGFFCFLGGLFLSQLVWNLVAFFLMSKFCPQYC